MWMKTVKDWVSGLKISSEKYESWLREAPAGESFTYWCLQTGRLDENAYIEWAREFYHLPSLNSEFFARPPRHDLWQSIQSVANWSASLIPIAEWDGVIYIVCVEPSPETRWSFPVQYLLARAHDLKNFWQALVVMDEPVFAAIPPTPDKQTTGAPPIEPPPLGADNPAGLNLGAIKIQSASNERDFMSELETAVSPKADNLKTASPEGEKEATADDDATVAPEGFVLNTVAPPKIEFSSAPAEGAKAEGTASEVTQIHTQFLSKMVTKFSGAMIIEVSGDHFVPSIWNESFRAVNDRARQPWDLNTASAFRIAFRTGQPYLGHVVPTELNSEFFKAWGFEDAPKSILVQPVKNAGDKVSHFLLFLADDQKHFHQLLTDAEKLAAEFSESPTIQKSAA